jgi:hypothetical protein
VHATDEVQDAFKAFTRALQNTGSRMAVAEFSTVARLPLSGAAQSNYTTVTTDSIANVFDPYIEHRYAPFGGTNWEDGFRAGRYFLPRPDPVRPHLAVFITDETHRHHSQRPRDLRPGQPKRSRSMRMRSRSTTQGRGQTTTRRTRSRTRTRSRRRGSTS